MSPKNAVESRIWPPGNVQGLVTAEEARQSYARREYLEQLDRVNKMIRHACKSDHKLAVTDVPSTVSLDVKDTLERYGGFDVILIHDPENGSSELTIRW